MQASSDFQNSPLGQDTITEKNRCMNAVISDQASNLIKIQNSMSSWDTNKS